MRIKGPRFLLRLPGSPNTPRSTRLVGIYPARKSPNIISARSNSPLLYRRPNTYPAFYTVRPKGGNYRFIGTVIKRNSYQIGNTNTIIIIGEIEIRYGIYPNIKGIIKYTT